MDKIVIRALFYFVTVIFVLAEFFLIMRFILKLLGANPESFFAAIIYAGAYFFTLPFLQIFPRQNLPGEAAIDTVAFTAIFGYLATYAVIMVVTLLSKVVFDGTTSKKNK